MNRSKFGHEGCPQFFTTFFHQAGADRHLFGRLRVPQSPGADLGEQGDELDGRLGETVNRFLLVSGVASSREQACAHQTSQPIGQNIGSDAFGGKLQKIAVVAATPEHDVADDDQAPAITEHLHGEIDGTFGAPCFSHLDGRAQIRPTSCILQQTRGIVTPLAKCK